MTAAGNDDRDSSITGRLTLALALVIFLVAGIGGWAATAPLRSAVVAPGQVVVDNNVKRIQHPSGGVVGAINVKNGDLVEAGQVLVSLDPTQAKANLGIVASQIMQLVGRKARLEAELAETDEISWPAALTSGSQEAAAVKDGEERFFKARREALRLQKSQLTERVGQLSKEIEGLEAQLKSKAIEVELMEEEYARVKDMFERKLVNKPRELSAERDLTRLKGEAGVLTAQIARARGQISETELQRLGIDQNLRSEANNELRQVEARLAELEERRLAAEDLLRRIDITAPQAGVVHELAVHTIGGVINASETLMLVVPTTDELSIEIRVAPQDIDQIAIGQELTLRFSAFNQRTTPEVKGRITRIAAAATHDQQTGASYYIGRASVNQEEAEKVAHLRLVPGMPVEAFMQTGERTALSFLIKPLTDQLARAWLEE